KTYRRRRRGGRTIHVRRTTRSEDRLPMKLSLIHSLSIFGARFFGVGLGVGIALATTGCSGSNSTNMDGPGGAGADGGAAAQNDPPHALGMITLAEMHSPSGGQSTPLVSAVFVPDSSKKSICGTTLAGCSIPMLAQ